MGKIADRYLLCEPWRIVQRGFDPGRQCVSESLFSLANEYMGLRGYAEEGCSAPGLIGSYFGGVYEWGDEPEGGGYKGVVRRTHYMVCAADWLRVDLGQAGQAIRLDENARDYECALDLRTGLITRRYTTLLPDGANLTLTFQRLLGMEDVQVAAQRITLESDRDTVLDVQLLADGTVIHQMTGKCQWREVGHAAQSNRCGMRMQTATTGQTVAYLFAAEGAAAWQTVSSAGQIGLAAALELKAGVLTEITRRIRNTVGGQGEIDLSVLDASPSFEALLESNRIHYERFWQLSDIEIDGDKENQQGIRYCLFQLHQTYRGLDATHNIGAKGLTGEAYNGHAFWDSETYCLPYYLLNDPAAARSLLMYRYHTLPQARARARQLDCAGACFPIATLNGYEACTLWQHASLQMQPSTAVAYAVMCYAAMTGDQDFLHHEGLELLIDISRYVVSRGDWNADHTGFGFWGVMGPDEFHMMVNNDYYTNHMGRRTLLDTLQVLSEVPEADTLVSPEERAQWREIANHMLVSQREDGVFEQHDGYFTLPHIDIHTIPVEDFPLYSHWSYDRIYRTDMIKQPDVLMAMFLHLEDFTPAELEANYRYYEPRCIHESSLSPSIHAILAQRLGMDDAAFDFFGFATRMDLDNYNRNTAEGLHLTSIAAAWVTIVYGFGGLQMAGEQVTLAPRLPRGWTRCTFRFRTRDSVVKADVTGTGCTLTLVEGPAVTVILDGKEVEVTAHA